MYPSRFGIFASVVFFTPNLGFPQTSLSYRPFTAIPIIKVVLALTVRPARSNVAAY
jgi:hypothetical protein